MKVGVLGSGDVAKALAEGFIKHGHPTMIGTRDPAKLAEWRQDNRKTKVGSFSETAAFGEVLALAVKGSVAADVLRLAGSANLDGKLVMDACNPIADAPPVNGVLKFFTTLDDSLMERLQRAFPKAHFVKAFSSVGHGQFVNPQYKAGKPTMFICGNDDGAKVVTAQILEQFGWETADMGKVESARAIEPLSMLWCVLGFTKNEWTHAFKLLHQ
jgi:predicted dinucleotide-binding enzyme